MNLGECPVCFDKRIEVDSKGLLCTHKKQTFWVSLTDAGVLTVVCGGSGMLPHPPQKKECSKTTPSE